MTFLRNCGSTFTLANDFATFVAYEASISTTRIFSTVACFNIIQATGNNNNNKAAVVLSTETQRIKASKKSRLTSSSCFHCCNLRVNHRTLHWVIRGIISGIYTNILSCFLLPFYSVNVCVSDDRQDTTRQLKQCANTLRKVSNL